MAGEGDGDWRQVFAATKQKLSQEQARVSAMQQNLAHKQATVRRLNPSKFEPYGIITLGVCAMAKKANCKPMKEILGKLKPDEFQVTIFDERMILEDPIETWPICDCLIAFYSSGFPQDKAEAYVTLRKPKLVNDLVSQRALWNRRSVYEICTRHDIPVPKHFVVLREGQKEDNDSDFIETDSFVQLGEIKISKPFVEKPLDAENHNVFIYYPPGSGGGRKELFRKIGDRSSDFFPDRHKVRRDGSYLYEEFLSTEGTDVKVYSVTAEYHHAEARKSPSIDGRVSRDENNSEIRYPVMLTSTEKEMARKVVLGFQQNVCGFDMLRSQDGKSYVCDVNGWSFVKKSAQYHKDSALMLSNLLRTMMGRPNVVYPLSESDSSSDEEDGQQVEGRNKQQRNKHHEELRAVIAIVRHGDRTPKQKLKVTVRDSRFLELFTQFGSKKSLGLIEDEELKLKTAKELGEVLRIVKEILSQVELGEDSAELFEVKELEAFAQVRAVLEMHGQFRGINRKVQLKRYGIQEAQLIVKWGGTLTPQGRDRAEELGRSFRSRMYPGDGLLRLHSTFRHDLKIYASDEGRVQVTAAAFAKGLLDLEGHLTPILETLVKKGSDINTLLHDASQATYAAKRAKQRVKQMLTSSEPPDLTELPVSVARALRQLGMPPLDAMGELHVKIKLLVGQLKFFLRPAKKRLPITSVEDVGPARTPTPSLVAAEDECESVNASLGGQPAIDMETLDASANKIDRGDGLVTVRDLFRLAHARWAKLDKDFFSDKTGEFDISKIPDIYDCAKYDVTHNPEFLKLRPANLVRIFDLAKHLADAVVPQEYGEAPREKFEIGILTCRDLLGKIRDDLAAAVQHSAGNGSDDTSSQMDDVRSVAESEIASSSDVPAEAQYRLDRKLAKSMGIKNADRHVRTRLYFTSESHLHALINVLRFAHLFNPSLPKPTEAALRKLMEMEELSYLCHVVIKLYEVSEREHDGASTVPGGGKMGHILRIYASDGIRVTVIEPQDGGEIRVNVGCQTATPNQAHQAATEALQESLLALKKLELPSSSSIGSLENGIAPRNSFTSGVVRPHHHVQKHLPPCSPMTQMFSVPYYVGLQLFDPNMQDMLLTAAATELRSPNHEYVLTKALSNDSLRLRRFFSNQSPALGCTEEEEEEEGEPPGQVDLSIVGEEK
ncbi:hypothetical protein BASA81_015065 [Batrachochytrium salamandrivorans]|nr:hypothetical protein BASA81_015065 [Batrachochytrium salamandrivorans]